MAVETFTLPPLPYDYSALEPYVDATTMQVDASESVLLYSAEFDELLILQYDC